MLDTVIANGHPVMTWPPQIKPEDKLYVLKYSDDVKGQEYGQTYVTNFTTPNARNKLQADVQSGAMVYALIYRLAPISSITAWAWIKAVHVNPLDSTLTFDLEQQEFPVPVHYLGSMGERLPWVANLGSRGQSISTITEASFKGVVDWAKKLTDLLQMAQSAAQNTPSSSYYKTGGFNSIVDQLLDNTAEKTLHLQYEILPIMLRVPQIQQLFGDTGTLERWLLGILSEDKRFQNKGNNVWVISNNDGETNSSEPVRPAAINVIQDQNNHVIVAPLATQDADTPSALESNSVSDRSRVEAMPEPQSVSEPASVATDEEQIVLDAPLRVLDDDELIEKLKVLGTSLMFDEQVVRRIYRSLVAGRHVVLSGPPGTGKTRLARLLPGILWSEEVSKAALESLEGEVATDDAELAARQKQDYKGYYSYVVTATEDWGVRDVIGGIGPVLSGDNNSPRQGLSYTILYGELVKAVLQNYKGTAKGQKLPASLTNPPRVAFTHPNDQDKKQYKGVWLIIDEFTRAPVDAAFGSLLTTLGSADNDGRSYLAVPAANNEYVRLPLPQDFRIIGTLNSFDRHFLNQISEALKRRFDFIDILPPPYEWAEAEQGIAIDNALKSLQKKAFVKLTSPDSEVDDPQKLRYYWRNKILITLVKKEVGGVTRLAYAPGELSPEARNEEVQTVLDTFWRIFDAIRVFRQLGTAQAETTYTNLFAGGLIGMGWEAALDTALADSLADQLQVLNRDEQELLLAYLEQAGNEASFKASFQQIWGKLSDERQLSLAHTLREAEQYRYQASTASADQTVLLNQVSHALARIFKLGGGNLALPAQGVFYKRLRNLIYERGL